MYGYGAYRINEHISPPSLADCLSRTKIDIEGIFLVRAPLLDRRMNATKAFNAMWNDMCDEISADPDTATEYDEAFERFRMWGSLPEFRSLIRAPVALWLESRRAFDRGDIEVSWLALVRCNYFLGMCSSHETKRERAARGGRHSGNRVAPIKKMVLEMLRAMPTKSHVKKQDIWAIIEPAMAKFSPARKEENDPYPWLRRLERSDLDVYREALDQPANLEKSKIPRSTNPSQLLRRWTNNDPEIKSEFLRIVSGSLKTRIGRDR